MSNVYVVITGDDLRHTITMFKLKEDESAEQVGKDTADGIGEEFIEVMHIDDFVNEDDIYDVVPS